MAENATYLIRIYRYFLERADNNGSSTILKLLSRRIPSSEIEQIQSEISDPRYAIRRQIAKRKIKYLVHFTQSSNVASILKYGLIPRQLVATTLGPESDSIKFNDRFRYDAHLDASCLSITLPNYRMFFRYKKMFRAVKWAVLRIDPAVLWRLDCAFCVTNASSKRISNTLVNELKGISAFDALFEDFVDETIAVKRSDLRLPKNVPTNPQAEVLVFDIIPPDSISAVCLPRIIDYSTNYKNSWRGVDVCIEYEYFGPRKDYKVWSKTPIG